MKKRSKPKTVWYDRGCPYCKQMFKTKYSKKVFCSDKCRMDDWMSKHPRVSLEKSIEQTTQED